MGGAGYTPAQIDALTLFDVRELFDYWREYPPAPEMLKVIARALRVEFKPLASRRADNDDGPTIEKLKRQRADLETQFASNGFKIPPRMTMPGKVA